MNQQTSSSSKTKNTIFNFLPRPTSSVSFQNPPIYTRQKTKNDAVLHEPTSPKVSCMGLVKCKYAKDKLRLAGNKLPPAGKILRLTSGSPESSKTESKSKKMLGFKKLLSGVIIITPGCGGRRKPVAVIINGKAPLCLDKAPSLSMMKRFSSGRDKLSDIDWTKDSGDRNYDSDEESSVIVPSSAPVVMRNIPLGFEDKFDREVAGNTEPRKEINLWKRRTLPQPKPLLLHNI